MAPLRNSEEKVILDQRTVKGTSGGRTGRVREHPYFKDVHAEEDGLFLIVNEELAVEGISGDKLIF